MSSALAATNRFLTLSPRPISQQQHTAVRRIRSYRNGFRRGNRIIKPQKADATGRECPRSMPRVYVPVGLIRPLRLVCFLISANVKLRLVRGPSSSRGSFFREERSWTSVSRVSIYLNYIVNKI